MIPADAMLDALEALRATPTEDAILDLMDRVSGNCAPHAKLAGGIDVDRLGHALHEVYCHRNAPMHSEPYHSAEAIVAAYEAESA